MIKRYKDLFMSSPEVQFWSVTVFLFVLLAPLVPRRGPPVLDQKEMVDFLKGAQPLRHKSVVDGALLPNGAVLRPEQKQNIYGYVMNLHLSPCGYTIEGQPDTWLFSFFREPVKPATVSVRWWVVTPGNPSCVAR